MKYDHRPAEWKTLYPDCPIGLRITDLWLNKKMVIPRGDAPTNNYKNFKMCKPIYLTKGGEKIWFESYAAAGRHIDVSYQTIFRYGKSGKELKGHYVIWA